MEITLHKANIDDCIQIHKMQVEAFKHLLEKYNDIRTNPGAESIEKVILKIKQPTTDYYLIKADNENIGSIRIVNMNENIFRIAPIFISPDFQGQGFAQQTIALIEKLYPQAVAWQLSTIKEESKLCHLYEKMGYKATGKEEIIQDNMTIVYYIKTIN